MILLRPEIKKTIQPLRALGKPLPFLAAYSLWTLLFKLLVLTLVTYFAIPSSIGHSNHLQDLSETFGAYELTFMSLGSLLFIILLKLLNPFSTDEVFTPARFEKHFVPGFVQGALLASMLILVFVLSGLYRYLGFFVQFESPLLALAGVFIRIAALGVLAFCEEFIFRYKLLNHADEEFDPRVGVLFTALAYCGIKMIQFDLGIMHLLTLFLISISLSMRTTSERDFNRGAGFWAAILIVFHPLLSLPILGNEFSGIILFKPQPMLGDLARLLTGGAGGPLSSFGFQLLIVLDIIRTYANRTPLSNKHH